MINVEEFCVGWEVSDAVIQIMSSVNLRESCALTKHTSNGL